MTCKPFKSPLRVLLPGGLTCDWGYQDNLAPLMSQSRACGGEMSAACQSGVTDLIVNLKVGGSDEVLAACGCVALYTCEDVLHCSRYDSPLGAIPLPLHRESLSSSCLPIGNNGRIVPLQENDTGCLAFETG